jgi:hypothetical protein
VYKLAANKLSATGLWGEAKDCSARALQSLGGSASRQTNAPPPNPAASSLSDTDDDDFNLFLQKQQPAHRYIPIGYISSGIKETHVMMLPSCPLWYYDDPFTPLIDVVVC